MVEIVNHAESVSNITSLLETVCTSLVEDKDALKIEVSEADSDTAPVTTYSIVPAESDVALIIGRRGRNIKSIRTLARAAAAFAHDGKVEVEVVG